MRRRFRYRSHLNRYDIDEKNLILEKVDVELLPQVSGPFPVVIPEGNISNMTLNYIEIIIN